MQDLHNIYIYIYSILVLFILIFLIHSWKHVRYHTIGNYNFFTVQTSSICLPLFAFHQNDRCCYRSILSFIHPVVVFLKILSSRPATYMSNREKKDDKIIVTAKFNTESDWCLSQSVCLLTHTRLCRWNMSQFSCLRFFSPSLVFLFFSILHSTIANGSRLWVIIASSLTK